MSVKPLNEETEPLAQALSVLGYELGSPDPNLGAALGGPLTQLTAIENDAPVALITTVDRADGSADASAQSIAGALSRVRPELVLRPGDPVAGLDALLAAVDPPCDVLPISENGAVIGALLLVVERRSAPTETAASGSLGTTGVRHAGETIPLSRLRDVQLQVTVELGRTAMIVSDVLALEIGSVIELDRSAGAPIDVRVNGTLLARGEVVVVDDEYAIRLTEMIDPDRG